MGRMSISLKKRLCVTKTVPLTVAAGERSGERHVGIGAHGDRVVALHQDFVGLQAQVEDRLGELGSLIVAAELEGAAADFALEGIEAEGVVGEAEPRLERRRMTGMFSLSKRAWLRSSAAAAAEHRLFHGARDAHIDAERAVDPAHLRARASARRRARRVEAGSITSSGSVGSSFAFCTVASRSSGTWPLIVSGCICGCWTMAASVSSLLE